MAEQITINASQVEDLSRELMVRAEELEGKYDELLECMDRHQEELPSIWTDTSNVIKSSEAAIGEADFLDSQLQEKMQEDLDEIQMNIAQALKYGDDVPELVSWMQQYSVAWRSTLEEGAEALKAYATNAKEIQERFAETAGIE